jgi:hypothetical protein
MDPLEDPSRRETPPQLHPGDQYQDFRIVADLVKRQYQYVALTAASVKVTLAFYVFPSEWRQEIYTSCVRYANVLILSGFTPHRKIRIRIGWLLKAFVAMIY